MLQPLCLSRVATTLVVSNLADETITFTTEMHLHVSDADAVRKLMHHSFLWLAEGSGWGCPLFVLQLFQTTIVSQTAFQYMQESASLLFIRCFVVRRRG
jgi:hypothetical protein